MPTHSNGMARRFSSELRYGACATQCESLSDGVTSVLDAAHVLEVERPAVDLERRRRDPARALAGRENGTVLKRFEPLEVGRSRQAGGDLGRSRRRATVRKPV